MAVRRGERDQLDDESPAAPAAEDHRWLREAEQELEDREPETESTTKVGKVRMAKVRRAPGPRKRRR